MINEELTQKECNLAVRIGSLAASEIRKALEKLIADLEANKGRGARTPELSKQPKEPQKPKEPELKKGKQTLKQLHQHNEGLSSVELKDPNLRQLYRAMKKDDVDFACVKDGKGKYTLFFKGKNVDEVTHALKQYTQKLVKLDKAKPSIKSTLDEAKKTAQSINVGRDKVKNMDKGAR